MDAFVFVRPTGKPLSEALGTWAREQADYAISEWMHFFRGEPRVKNDTDVTAADIAANNLVLFGDPSSNAVYKRIADRLPIQWRAGRRHGRTGEVPRLPRARLRLSEPAQPEEVRRHQQRLHVSRPGQQRHAVAEAARLGGRRHHEAGEQLSLSAAVRRVAGLLRRELEAEGAGAADRREQPASLALVAGCGRPVVGRGTSAAPRLSSSRGQPHVHGVSCTPSRRMDPTPLLPLVVDEAFDEVDRIDRLMSHYKADSALSRLNRDAAGGRSRSTRSSSTSSPMRCATTASPMAPSTSPSAR